MSLDQNKAIYDTEFIEIVVFYVAEIPCALRAVEIQSIIQNDMITPVHHAPDYVNGVINLRGQIVTTIDMRAKFNLDAKDSRDKMKVVIVKHNGEVYGLSVDSVDDILKARTDLVDLPPSNVKGLNGTFFTGIYKNEDSLIAIINLDEILKPETE